MKTVTVCGSMRFAKDMQEIAFALETQQGYNVLCCIAAPEHAVLTDRDRERLSLAHRRKIELSDGIYVVNIGGYIGESTQSEIHYAQSLSKEIIMHHPDAQA